MLGASSVGALWYAIRPYKQPLQVSATQTNIQTREPMLNAADTQLSFTLRRP
jgi:hypothetical protein